MVVGPLCDGIHELGAVWYHTAIIGKAVLIRIVGHSVVRCCLLGPHYGHQHHQHQEGHDWKLNIQDHCCNYFEVYLTQE